MDNSDLAKRMKEYESVPKSRLIRRMPVIFRIDGKAFHSFTKGFQRPFDEVLIKTMQETTKYLCENIQGCVLGYTQSDEISLVLVDYKKLNSSSWFDYEVQKIVSIAASMATMAFNKYFDRNAHSYFDHHQDYEKSDSYRICRDAYLKALEKGAMFDARCFNLSKEEVTNYIYWRQLDASRNSVQMVGQANFSHKQLINKTCNDIQDMLMVQKGINWNDLPTYQKRGSCCIKEKYMKDNVERSKWIIDKDIPIFKSDGREYIERLIIPAL